MKKTDKLLIELEDWEYRCGDGCCYDYGTNIKVNGELLEQDGYNLPITLEAVLSYLGYKNIEIEYI